MLSKFAVLDTFVATALAQATAPEYGQCGGVSWTGATTCPSGWTCTVSNEYYSQCLPGAASSSPSSPTSPTTTAPGAPTSSVPSPTVSAPSGTATAGSDGFTLLPNNLWLRADEDPEFHHYLQSEISGTPGPAVLGSYLTAAQYQLNGGQFEQQLASGGVLYLVVNTTNPQNLTYLPTYFSTAPASVGTFAWQGDGLTWTAPNIARQDIGAWLACGGGDTPGAYINLGAYDYMTPTGCADETLNYYNGATPTP